MFTEVMLLALVSLFFIFAHKKIKQILLLILIMIGLNPLVATDAICFMPWIASEYGLKLPEEYEEIIKNRESCRVGTGDKTDINKEVCW